MAIGLAIQKLAGAVVRGQCSSQEVGEVIKAEVRNLILTIGDIQLSVIEATESERMTAMDPVVDRGALYSF